MIKLKQILEETLKYKKSTYGEFVRFDFFDTLNQNIGYTNIRLKKDWNQLHVNIEDKFQGKGYAKEFIDANLKNYDYVTFPEGRIVNPLFKKVINKFENNSKYDVFDTKYNETVISNKKKSKEEILKALG